MTDPAKVAKLINKLDDFIHKLENLRVIIVHQEVNQFYYMQKVEELTFLHSQLSALIEKQSSVQQLIDIIYPQVLSRWQQDARWVNSYKTSKETFQDLSM